MAKAYALLTMNKTRIKLHANTGSFAHQWEWDKDCYHSHDEAKNDAKIYQDKLDKNGEKGSTKIISCEIPPKLVTLGYEKASRAQCNEELYEKVKEFNYLLERDFRHGLQSGKTLEELLNN